MINELKRVIRIKCVDSIFIVRVFSLFTFAFLTFWTSWCSDDAYHSFIMAKHFAEGDGLVYNVGYRVTASTCPLFTIIEGILYYLFGHMYFVAIGMGVFFSTVAVGLLICKVCKSISTIVLADILLLCSYCFMCYTTSGLENSLLFCLISLFLYVYGTANMFDEKKLFTLSLVAGFLAMTRMDAILMVTPAIIFAFFSSEKTFTKKLGFCLLGIIPFLLWEGFSFLYYGFPFPNTYYVKVCTQFPVSEYISSGLDFFKRSFQCDVFILIIPAFFVVYSVLNRNYKMIMSVLGILLYYAYVICVGGDFMLGRHLTVPYFLSVFGLLMQINENDRSGIALNGRTTRILWYVCLACIAFSQTTSSYYKSLLSNSNTFYTEGTAVADEKAFYTRGVGYTLNYIKANKNGVNPGKQWVGDKWFDTVNAATVNGDKGIFCKDMCSGMMAYYASDIADLYLTDKYGLMDPLLSHLPAEHTDYWRVGHMWRSIPSGYVESIQHGSNLIENDSLHEYYDVMLYVISGNVFDKERIVTSMKMNLGKYDYLIEEYLETE